MTPPTTEPTATELLNHAVVRGALDQAWLDSEASDPARRHEEGGWIYLDLSSGAITIRQAVPGQQASINLSNPPVVAGSVVVGKFHTHPNPSAEGWLTGPSPSDLAVDAVHGVPDMIRADDGVHLSGPNSRRGGLVGPPGYPN